MVNVVLVEPEIPQNTGNIARTCAITGARLHLVRPLGFDISEKAVKRAGLDYWHLLDLRVYENIDDFLRRNGDKPLWLSTTKWAVRYTDAVFQGNVEVTAQQHLFALQRGVSDAFLDVIHGSSSLSDSYNKWE